MAIRSRCTTRRAAFCESKLPSCGPGSLEFIGLEKASLQGRSAGESCAKESATCIAEAKYVERPITVTLRPWPALPVRPHFCKKQLKSAARLLAMGNVFAASMLWRTKTTLYSWRSAAASSLLMASVTLIYALCSTQLKQPKPTSWRSDAGAEPSLASLHYCELMDFCANSPALIAISSLPRVAESSLLCSPRVTLMLNNLPRSRPENPREIARCSRSAVQRDKTEG